MTLKKATIASAGLVFIALVLAIAYARETVVHRIPLPGYPDETIDFVLCKSMTGEHGYIVRFGGSETKRPLVSSDVPLEELKANARIEYEAQILTVYGPRGERMTVPGFIPK